MTKTITINYNENLHSRSEVTWNDVVEVSKIYGFTAEKSDFLISSDWNVQIFSTSGNTGAIAIGDFCIPERSYNQIITILKCFYDMKYLKEPLENFDVSMDVSTGENDADNRIFGKVIEVQGNTLLCEMTSNNFNLEKLQKENILLKAKNIELEDTLKSSFLRYDDKTQKLETKLNDLYTENTYLKELLNKK